VSTPDFNRLSFVYSFSDFDMSDAQQEHALAVEHLAPRLAALRIELCPGYMSEGCFWKIYFVLLHPRLSKHDAELLSTPQVCCFFVAGLVVSLIYLFIIIENFNRNCCYTSFWFDSNTRGFISSIYITFLVYAHYFY
jgi:hypothetical protein